MMILTLLPPAGLVLMTLICLGSEADQHRSPPLWQTGLVIGVAIWASVLIVLTETLSVLHAIAPLWLGLGWMLVDLVVIVIGRRTGRLVRGWGAARQIGFPETRWARTLLVGIILLVTAEFVVALVAPVNTVDALQYHMPRVLHWIQDHSLAHYPVVYQSANARPYWAELAILNLRVLWGSDRLVNLVQWGSMLYLLVLASGITALLGGRRRAQWLGAALAVSVPMGVLQSETAQNDLVSAMWAMVVAYLVILAAQHAPSRLEVLGLGLGVGVGLLTKGTVIMTVVPLLAWYSLLRWRTDGLRQLVREGAAIAAAAAVLNGAFWIRNTITYGGPYGSNLPIRIPGLNVAAPPATAGEEHQAAIEAAPSTTKLRVSSSGIATPLIFQIGKTARMVSLNFVTPVKWVNDRVFNVLSRFPSVFPPDFVNTLRASVWNYEMTAASPLHLLLIIAGLAGVAFLAWRSSYGLALGLGLSVVVGYGLLSAGGCSDWIYCIRYQLPAFYLGLPLSAVVLGRMRRFPWVMSGILLLYAVPYLLFSYMRPIIGMPPWPTRVGSVFTTSQEELLFALSPNKRDEYHLLAKQITSAACSRVGVALHWDDLEYTLWWELGAPESGTQLRYVEARSPTDKLIEPDYQPCAILCTTCVDLSAFHGLPLFTDAGHIKLFMDSPTGAGSEISRTPR